MAAEILYEPPRPIAVAARDHDNFTIPQTDQFAEDRRWKHLMEKPNQRPQRDFNVNVLAVFHRKWADDRHRQLRSRTYSTEGQKLSGLRAGRFHSAQKVVNQSGVRARVLRD